jgi:GNAT superfamily N-acetyltransferase
MIRDPRVDVGPLQPEAARDAALVERLAELVNGVYADAERGLWRDGATRTTPGELADMLRNGELIAARRNGRVVGIVRVHDVADDVSEFGLLVAAHTERGCGVGRALLDFAEARSRERGLRAMQLELLVPRSGSHPSKEFLRAWYGRRGYRLRRTSSMETAYPHLAPLLATPCDLEIHEKELQAASAFRG